MYSRYESRYLRPVFLKYNGSEIVFTSHTPYPRIHSLESICNGLAVTLQEK